MRNLHIKRRDLKDPVGIRYWPVPVGRDLARTPMQWDDTKFSGFTKDSKTWLPIHPNHKTINVKAESTDPSSLLSFYRRLIWTRKKIPALRRGSIEISNETPKGIFSYLREYKGETMLVVLNFKKRDYAISIGDLNKKIKGDKRWEVVLSTHRESGEAVIDNYLNIKPYEATILKPKK
jgi:alpha-glucosidase